jgi:hypothetical protein
MDAAPAAELRSWGWFAAWLLTGAAWAVGLIAITSIGLFVVPVAIVATMLLARRTYCRPGLPGLVAGLGLPPLYVAYLNRAGPGNVCTAISGGTTCTQEFDPWPWLIAGLALVAFGVVVFLIRARSGPAV